ncbi:MAG: hypothetical protein ACK56I_35515 [bacterium]
MIATGGVSSTKSTEVSETEMPTVGEAPGSTYSRNVSYEVTPLSSVTPTKTFVSPNSRTAGRRRMVRLAPVPAISIREAGSNVLSNAKAETVSRSAFVSASPIWKGMADEEVFHGIHTLAMLLIVGAVLVAPVMLKLVLERSKKMLFLAATFTRA